MYYILRLFNSLFSRTTRLSQHQKGKPFSLLMKMMVWHQQDHMQIICTLLQTDNHATTSPLDFLQARCPSCRPSNSIKALKAHTITCIKLITTSCMLHSSIVCCSMHVWLVNQHTKVNSMLTVLPSVLWRCWLGDRQGNRPVKGWVVGWWLGYLCGTRCRFAYGPTDATATQCLLLQEIAMGLPFWYWLTWEVPDKIQRAVKRL